MRLLKELRPWLVIFLLTAPTIAALYFTTIKKIDGSGTLTPMLWASFTRSILKISTIFPFFFVVTFAATTIALIFWDRHKSRLILTFLAALLATLFISSTGLGIFRLRFIIIALPFFAYFLGYIAWQSRQCGSISFKFAQVVLVILTCYNSVAAWNRPIERPPTQRYIMEGIEWLKQNTSPTHTIYVNYDRRDVLLYTSLHLIRASDFMGTEFKSVKLPLKPSEDPTWAPIEKAHWIYWFKLGDYNARVKKVWLNPNYVTINSIPASFELAFENQMVQIWRNSLLEAP